MQGIPEANRSSARRPSRPAWMGLIAALAIGVALAGCSGSTKTPDVKFVTPTPELTPTPEPTDTPEPTATPTPKPTPTPVPTVGPCSGAALTVTTSAWQNNAGHAQADFVVKNTGTSRCLIRSKSQPMLLNGDGTILITGPDPGNVASLNLAPGASAKSSVQTANLCAAPPAVPPVQVGFIMAGTGLVLAPPPSPTDIAGVPSCLGDNTIASGEIQMTTWVPQA